MGGGRGGDICVCILSRVCACECFVSCTMCLSLCLFQLSVCVATASESVRSV